VRMILALVAFCSFTGKRGWPMHDETPVPWAEMVPGAPFPMTLEAFQRWPDDARYELVRGRLVRLPFGSFGCAHINSHLSMALTLYIHEHHLGFVTGAGGGFPLPLPDEHTTLLLPCCAFTQTAHAPPKESKDWWGPWRGAPDLVAEIGEYDQPRQALIPKMQIWLAAGVRLAWLIWPSEEQVEVWLPGQETPALVLKAGDLLDGRDVVPGFSLPVADLFTD
jgi:Uma2 family endonuclease